LLAQRLDQQILFGPGQADGVLSENSRIDEEYVKARPL
jgi:hypothetical protein